MYIKYDSISIKLEDKTHLSVRSRDSDFPQGVMSGRAPKKELQDADDVQFFFFNICIYLAALGLSCGTQDLSYIVQDLSLQWMGSRACGLGFCSLQS